MKYSSDLTVDWRTFTQNAFYQTIRFRFHNAQNKIFSRIIVLKPTNLVDLKAACAQTYKRLKISTTQSSMESLKIKLKTKNNQIVNSRRKTNGQKEKT